jgi:hypothetical protein
MPLKPPITATRKPTSVIDRATRRFSGSVDKHHPRARVCWVETRIKQIRYRGNLYRLNSICSLTAT